MTELKRNQLSQRKWNVSLKVSFEEEQKIRIRAIKLGLGVGDYIKQAALEKLPIETQPNQGKLN